MIYFENIGLVFVFFFRFDRNIKIMRVCEASVSYSLNLLWHFISLLVSRIESVEHNTYIQLGSIREVRPVETISHVILINRSFYMFIYFFVFMESFFNIYLIDVKELSDFHDSL